MVTLLKERSYPVMRDGKTIHIHPTAKGFRETMDVSGGATATTPQSQAQAAQSALNAFLTVAPRKFYAINGTVPINSAGGNTSNVTWGQSIPIIPAFCTAIDYEVSMSINLVLDTTGNSGAATVSPFAPYSSMGMQLTLGGAPPWGLMEMTPWYLDQVNQRVDYDPFYKGLGGGGVAPFISAGTTVNLGTGILDLGLIPDNFGLVPGATMSNATTVTTSTNYTMNWRLRVQLQRKRHLLWGAVPFGDPENRPNNLSQLLPLIGTNPEQNFFVNAVGAATVATLHTQLSVNAIYELAYIDLLPPGMQAPPQPACGYGLQIVTSSPGITAAGTIVPMTHRTAMIYTQIHHILINSELPLRADYFALWDDQDQQSARWAFDNSVNNFNEYFDQFHRYWRRYPIVGQYTADFERGQYPEIPSVTPYDALMTPDQTYAATFGIPVTPAMTTSIRIPTGTAISTGYCRIYEFGLVRVPY